MNDFRLFGEEWWAYWAHWGIFVFIIINAVLMLVMGFIYFERRGLGRFQIRLGPNRCGPFGILQPVADAIKVFLKEGIIPAKGDKWIYWMAPVVAFLPVLMIFAVVPFHEGYGLVSNLNIGILYAIAIGALSVVGIFMAGWGSSNKYSLLGAMRSVAQIVSYEIPLVLSILGVVLITGSLSMNEIVKEQEAVKIPFFLMMPLGFLIYFLSAAAEISRSPFDLLEADSEIVAGFHIEYSGMKFAMFYLAEYGHVLCMSAIAATLFFGGWLGPGAPFTGAIWFLIKVFFIFFLLFWVRATVPRLRIDQWMGFAWKCLFPLALINLLVIGLEVIAWEVVWGVSLPWWLLFVNLTIAGGLILLWSRLFTVGGGKVEVREIRDWYS